MVIREGFFLVAQKLQEAADMAHSNVRQQLRDAVHDAHRKTGDWADYIDHTGDGGSGDVIYRAGGETRSAPYEIADLAGKVSTNVDTSKAKAVTPVVSYREMADDDDQYAAMQEALCKTAKLYTEIPLYERFISKAERDGADESSFAGKNKSFPILKPGDVGAAVHAMGRAGADNFPAAKLKANIIRIAKAKGWDNELPKAWRGTDATESAASVSRETTSTSSTGTLSLVESASFTQDVVLAEASRTNYPIKIISPGAGSSAYYSPDVVEKAASLVKPGTLMFWNHQTATEAAQRPEGDLDRLAAIVTKQGVWDPRGPKGPGIYAEAKVMADYAQKVEERAPHIGLSIRAGGTGTGKLVEGKPELASIDHIESVDYVTRAGRGGLALAEAARDAGILLEEGDDMTLKEAQDLVALEVKKATAPLILEGLKRAARAEGIRILEGVSLPEAAKTKIIDRSVAAMDAPSSPLLKEGAINLDEFRKVVVAEAKSEGEYLRSITGSGDVRGMGGASPFSEPITEAQREEAEKREKRARKHAKALQEGAVDIFARLTNGNREAAEAAAGKGGSY